MTVGVLRRNITILKRSTENEKVFINDCLPSGYGTGGMWRKQRRDRNGTVRQRLKLRLNLRQKQKSRRKLEAEIETEIETVKESESVAEEDQADASNTEVPIIPA